MTVPLEHSNLFTSYHIKEVGQPDHTHDERKTELQAVVSDFNKIPKSVSSFNFNFWPEKSPFLFSHIVYHKA